MSASIIGLPAAETLQLASASLLGGRFGHEVEERVAPLDYRLRALRWS